jgi:hypothetical protein
MMTLRRLSVLIITVLLVTGISGMSGIAGTAKTPTTTTSLSLPTTCLTNTSLTDLITCLINSVGDDAFSTIDLSTLLNPITTLAPAQHYIVMASASSSGASTQHYGPYASGSTDSGTCGPDWATDTFNRHFTVFQNKDDGSFVVVEQFKDGSFVTMAGSSPGACNTPNTNNGGTVVAGITGDLHGYFVIPLPAGAKQTSTSSSCFVSPYTDCTTFNFLNSHFTGCTTYNNPPCSVTTFFFHYSSGDQTLISHEWKNASADRGGNSGDIRSA